MTRVGWNSGPLGVASASETGVPLPAPHVPLVAGNDASLRNRAVDARREGRFDESERLLAQVVERVPADAMNWFERGATAFQAGRLESAVGYFRRAAELKPSFGEAHLNVGGVLEQLERQREALPWAQRAVDLLPGHPVAWYNLANIQRALADLQGSIRSFEKAMALDPHDLRVHWNLATCFLLGGDFGRGWQKYECRQEVGAVQLDRYTQPRWDGTSLAGKTLLVHAEQGIGDEVLFASCYEELISQADKLIAVCEPRLETLFRRSFPRATVYGYARQKDFPPLRVEDEIDVQISAGSVPQYLRPSAATFPQRERFLMPEAAAVALWRERLAKIGPGLKVGISWRAGGRVSERRRRTTEFDIWRELFALPGVEWINLQYGEADEEIAEAREQLGVTIHDHVEGDPLVDLDAFASKLAALDLVISVGNATAHLAGALGVPGWILLPQVPAWRWMIAGEASPWYRSLRLFRQQTLGDWAVPFGRVRDELERVLNSRAPSANLIPTIPQPLTLNPRFPENSPFLPAPHIRTPTENERLDCVHDDQVLSDVVIPQVLADAMALHRAGDFAAAETLYRQILRRAPRQADALHLLGVIARQTGRLDLALQSMGRALAVNNSQPVIHYNIANALVDAGRLTDAIASFRRAVELKADFGEAHLNLGLTLQKVGKSAEAVASFRAAAALAVHSAEAQWNLGEALRQACLLDEAAECYENAIGLDPTFVKAHNSLASVLLEDGRADEALAICRVSVHSEPNCAASYHTLGTVLKAVHRASDAIESFRQALALDPNRIDTLHNLANLLLAEGDAALAESMYRQAIAGSPHEPHPYNGLGQALEGQGQWRAAIECYEQALARDANYAAAHLNLGLARLRLGDLPRGWDGYEWRWRSVAGPRERNYFSQPLWDGSSLAGKTILVHGEQGLGDEILFASCTRDLMAMAGHVVLACDRRLAPLFARSFPQATVVTLRRSREHLFELPSGWIVDFQTPSGSVPRWLRREAAAFGEKDRFLLADPDKAGHWRARLDALGPGLKIGVSWLAGTSAVDRRVRSTTLDRWHEILGLPGAQFVSLQYGDCQEQIDELHGKSRMRLHTWSDLDPKGDIDELAALVSALDLVISVGNATAHLAGALGTPAWSLLPAAARWAWTSPDGPAGSESLWYASVRLFRQRQAGDWTVPFQLVGRELQAKIAQTADRDKMSPIVS